MWKNVKPGGGSNESVLYYKFVLVWDSLIPLYNPLTKFQYIQYLEHSLTLGTP